MRDRLRTRASIPGRTVSSWRHAKEMQIAKGPSNVADGKARWALMPRSEQTESGTPRSRNSSELIGQNNTGDDLMTTMLTSVARVQAGLAAIVEMIAGPGRIDIKVIARPQSVTRPYRVHIPSSIRRELYQFLGQLPQFKVLPHET